MGWPKPYKTRLIMVKRIPKIRDRIYSTFRLRPRERDKIRLMGKGSETLAGMSTRDLAFRGLIPILKSLQESLPERPDPQPLRVALPNEVSTLLEAISKRTGHPQIEVLLMAIETFRGQYAGPEPEPEAEPKAAPED